MKNLLLVLLAMGLGSLANASATIQEVPTNFGDLQCLTAPEAGQVGLESLPSGADLVVTIGKVINYGKAAWTFIQNNRSVVNIETHNASAMPAGIKDWSEMSGWKMPVVKTYRFNERSLMFPSVVEFEFQVMYTYGGQYQGRGQYLSYVTIRPTKLWAMWSYSVNGSVNIDQTLNVGTLDNPIGMNQISLHWVVDNKISSMEYSKTFAIAGDGQFVDLSAQR